MLTSGRQNNFDLIRLMAAMMVLFSHAFALTQGLAHGLDPLNRLTHGSLNFGSLGVTIFFVISGFLITGSYDHTRNLGRFLRSRVLRIFPALWIVILLTAFIVGPLFTSDALWRYITNPDTYRYLITLSVFVPVYHLPGVFLRNPYPHDMNGSLWTLTYELRFYLLVAVLGVLGLLRKWIILGLFVTNSLLLHFGVGGGNTGLFEFFSIGMVLYAFRHRISLSWTAAVITLAVAVAVAVACWPEEALLRPVWLLCGGYWVIWLAYFPPLRKASRITRFGDVSYGTYIYAFLIQQILIALVGVSMPWWLNFALALPITLAVATVSWYGIEKRALAFKGATTRKPVPDPVSVTL